MLRSSGLIPYLFVIAICCILIQACSTTKYVPDGSYLLVDAKIKSDTKAISPYEMETYIKQKPNFKTFSIFKLPLTLYNISGRDTTKLVNRIFKKAGEEPVIFDSTKVDRTVTDLKRMMTNKGYLDAEVDPILKLNKKKAYILYNISAHEPFKINNYKIEISDSVITKITLPQLSPKMLRENRLDSTKLVLDTLINRNRLVKKDANFDLDMLDKERDRITTFLKRIGFYAFNKEFIGFVADTTVGQNKVDLELKIYPFQQQGQSNDAPHKQYRVKEVDLYVDYNPIIDGDITGYKTSSIYQKDGYRIMYGPRGQYIKPEALLDKCYIRPGVLYNENSIAQTYSSLAQLRILKNVNISFSSDSTELRCIITCVPDKRQGISTEFDGTNSGGFFGLGASVGYLHRNAFKRSEMLNLRLHGAYEAITPNFSSFSDNYFEIGSQTSLTVPRFIFPFLKKDLLRRMHASTEFSLEYSYQRRPGYFTRTVLASGVKYIWQDRRHPLKRHAFDLINVSYVHVPPISDYFSSILTDAAKRYSFTDQFIAASGYTYTNTNLSGFNDRSRSATYSIRASVESAGNALALIANVANVQPDSIGEKKIFGTKFVQYLKGTIDYSKTYNMDDKNSFAWRLGGGIAYAYGNYKEVPIQKRFFAGGANSVRGWSVRELGPGSFSPTDKNFNNFFYHSGDIRFDANLEYRSKLFWVVELAAFVDAGNIWNIKKQKDLEGADFAFDRFYKEIALAWGLGVRLDFNFVLVRLDSGWKAYDPAGNSTKNKWAIAQPLDFGKNMTFHIAVGYPF